MDIKKIYFFCLDIQEWTGGKGSNPGCGYREGESYLAVNPFTWEQRDGDHASCEGKKPCYRVTAWFFIKKHPKTKQKLLNGRYLFKF